MKSYPYVPNMVQAITVLTVLKMMTRASLAQTPCGTGSMNGKLMYERLPNIQLQGFDDDIVSDTGPPFMVLEKCQDLCLRDRSSNNVVRPCSSIDFQPGSRLATYNGGPEYEESTCYLTAEQSRPEGMGSLVLVPNSIHFNEICITSNRPERECPNRKYLFERHPRKKLNLPTSDIKSMSANNRTQCEDMCLNEFSFVCRSATFDSAMGNCILSRFTRRTHPELLIDDPNSDYLENTCLNADRRCDGLAVFIKEENKRLGGPFEVDMFTNLTLEECQGMCVRAEKYFCRSIEYDEMSKQCTLSEEDSISQKDDIGVASSPTHHFYDFACLDSQNYQISARGSEYPDNSVTSHLFTGKKPDTAFQRYRNSRLGGEHQSEISQRTLSECLDECLRQPSFQCRSAEYSERYRSCRLSRYNQKDGMRIIYDADYDYYENLMLGGDESGGGSGRPGEGPFRPGEGYRPGEGGYRPGDGLYRPGSDRFRPSSSGSRFPPTDSRYPGPGRYPPSGGGYPDRLPPSAGGRYPEYPDYDRYPAHRPPYDRYPEYDDRYPDDRYTIRGGGGKYPVRPPIDRYPPSSSGGYPSRYPPSSSGGSYPDRRYPPGDKYDDRYGDRYGGNSIYGGGGYKYENRYGSRYGGGYGSRYGDDDRFGSGFTNVIGDDRYYGGSRYGNRYGSNRYNGNRYDYYGDDRDGGNRWFFRPDRRPGGRPVDGPPYDRPPPPPPPVRPIDDRPPYGNRRPLSPGPDGPIYDNFGGIPPSRPFGTRCDEGDNFKQIGLRQRARKEFVRRTVYAPSLSQCQRECIESRDFICRSFNYRDVAPGAYDGGDRENCELSDRDTRDMEVNNPQFFDNNGNYDFYERGLDRQGLDGDCLDVSQVCNEDGMEFTLRTPEGFYGRIYTYGFYDRCFFRGNGGTVNVLRISGAQGYPECGTQRYGDTMTNIVVVQFSDFVQTGKDKRFNLTCLFRGPGEAVVSSGFIGAGSGSPIPIEYLPAENTLSSKVRLMILYQGRPTTTIAVGDPLTFRLEAQDGYNYVTDIFATNVVARDPYSGRSVQLIDRYGCPVDSYIFPELDKGRNGDSLEARFNAFKLPESNFLVFEATVRTCRDGCQPAYCPSNSGRSEPSFGRRKREINETALIIDNNATNSENLTNQVNDTDLMENEIKVSFPSTTVVSTKMEESGKSEEESKENAETEYVREVIEVFDSREQMEQEESQRDSTQPLKAKFLADTVCLSPGEYHGLVSAILILIAILLTMAVVCGLAYKRYWTVIRKNIMVDRASSMSSTYPRSRSTESSGLSTIFGTQKQFLGFRAARNFPSLPKDSDIECPGSAPGGLFEDPSEPIYTDPSLFERARSLRSIAVSTKRRLSPDLQN